MKSGSLPLLAAALAGALAASAGFVAWSARPASAQQLGPPIGGVGTLSGPTVSVTNPPQPAAVEPQPISVQPLDPMHFVVATREPRLVTRDGKTAQNMLVTVVTYYTVRPDRLVPVEHVRVPTGYQLIQTEL
ncbi:MAG: hypothetical protein ACK47B_08120 [Armatimonadota bacterium]